MCVSVSACLVLGYALNNILYNDSYIFGTRFKLLFVDSFTYFFLRANLYVISETLCFTINVLAIN